MTTFHVYKNYQGEPAMGVDPETRRTVKAVSAEAAVDVVASEDVAARAAQGLRDPVGDRLESLQLLTRYAVTPAYGGDLRTIRVRATCSVRVEMEEHREGRL